MAVPALLWRPARQFTPEPRMSSSRFLFRLIPLLLLAACGGPPGDAGSSNASGTTPASAGSARTAPANTAASAAEVAREARGRLRCPPKLTTAARAADAPIDDVLGVRPGLGYDEAALLVQCSHDLMVVTADTGRRFNIQTYGLPVRQGFHGRFAQERVVKSGQDYIREMQDNAIARGNNRVVRDVAPGEAKWYVGTVGLPGEERVTNVAREEWFAAGKQPPIETVVAALVAKYGAPTEKRMQGGATLHWAYDTAGQQISQGDRLFTSCRHPPEPDAGSSFSTECGVVVAAKIVPLRDNPDIAQFMQLGITDQARGYALITSTERRLQQLDAERRAREVQDAAKNAQGPAL
jgi:hypothetical protein